jgi:hypothetical protein
VVANLKRLKAVGGLNANIYNPEQKEHRLVITDGVAARSKPMGKMSV